MISMIAAQGLHREIGLDGKMPWSLPGDSEHFKKLTQGHTMLMGRGLLILCPAFFQEECILLSAGIRIFGKIISG